jgi:hypothetical protein
MCVSVLPLLRKVFHTFWPRVITSETQHGVSEGVRAEHIDFPVF